MKHFLRYFFVFCVLCFVAADMRAAFAQVPAIAPSACDPQYYNTLKSRAWLEAQREITQNQNLILQPDSVLVLSCFGTALADYSSQASSMMSRTVDVGGAQESASSFVDGNFKSAAMLAGRSDVSPANSLTLCDSMSQVWEDLQCMNFTDEPNFDGFYSLKEYVDSSADKRFGASCGDRPEQWKTEYQALADGQTEWEEDWIFSFAAEFDKDGVGGCANSMQIATGVQTTLVGGDDTQQDMVGELYNHRICVRNGCTFIPTSATDGECQ